MKAHVLLLLAFLAALADETHSAWIGIDDAHGEWRGGDQHAVASLPIEVRNSEATAMTRATRVAAAIVLLSISGATSAWADKVTLANGDVLTGRVVEEPGRVRLRHAVLGEVVLARSDVMWITRDVNPAAVPVTAPAVAVSCTPCAPPAKETSEEECPSPWDFAVGLQLVNDSGNTEKLQFGTDLEAAYRWRVNRLHWRAQTFYETNQGVQTEGRVNSRLTYTREISPRGRLFGQWLVDRDDFADIAWRHGWFAGYQHDFVKRERTTFTGALGAGAVAEKRKGFDWFETAALMAQLEYRHEFQGGDSFEGMYYVVPYLDNTRLSPMRLELRYAHPLRNRFDITAAFLADYVADPPGDVEPLDTKITIGLRWRP